jgi:mono/diheme cytochrome c family protein
MDLSQAGEKQERKIDPLLLGKRIYNNCISCHQASGEGIAGQYPPLNQSRWVTGDERILARILLNGLNGPIVVRGSTYNAQMPAWKQFSDRDIAAVLTYIRSAWDNDAPPVAEETLARIRAETAGKAGAYTAAELYSLDLPEISESSSMEAEGNAFHRGRGDDYDRDESRRERPVASSTTSAVARHWLSDELELQQ